MKLRRKEERKGVVWKYTSKQRFGGPIEYKSINIKKNIQENQLNKFDALHIITLRIGHKDLCKKKARFD